MNRILGETPEHPVNPVAGPKNETQIDMLAKFRAWEDGGMVDAFSHDDVSCSGEVIVGSGDPIREVMIQWTGSDHDAVDRAFLAYQSPPGMSAKNRTATHNINNNSPSAKAVYRAEVRSIVTPELASKL